MKKKPKILVVFSRYNSSRPLIKSAWHELDKNNIIHDTLCCDGAFEIPVAISRLSKKYDGFIAVGCIIKGQTANFDLISSAITNGIMQISVAQKKPIGNSIITLFNRDQASQRFDRGKEAARAVLEILKIK